MPQSGHSNAMIHVDAERGQRGGWKSARAIGEDRARFVCSSAKLVETADAAARNLYASASSWRTSRPKRSLRRRRRAVRMGAAGAGVSNPGQAAVVIPVAEADQAVGKGESPGTACCLEAVADRLSPVEAEPVAAWAASAALGTG